MSDLTFANLIRLNRSSELNLICFDEDSYEEGELGPFGEYKQEIDEQICRELKIPNIASRFIEYGWYGYNNPPWSTRNILPFDPSLTSVIISETGQSFNIRGENRRVVLTFPPNYKGHQPFYMVGCSSERQIENVRVLNPYIERYFYGLENVFTQKGFESLPKLKDVKNFGLIIMDEQQVIVPQESREFF